MEARGTLPETTTFFPCSRVRNGNRDRRDGGDRRRSERADLRALAPRPRRLLEGPAERKAEEEDDREDGERKRPGESAAAAPVALRAVSTPASSSRRLPSSHCCRAFATLSLTPRSYPGRRSHNARPGTSARPPPLARVPRARSPAVRARRRRARGGT